MKDPFYASEEASVTALRKALDQAEAVVIGAGAGLSISAGLRFPVPGSISIFMISQSSMDFRICIPAGFIPMIRWRNTGLTGAAILNATATVPHPIRFMKPCWSW